MDVLRCGGEGAPADREDFFAILADFKEALGTYALAQTMGQRVPLAVRAQLATWLERTA